MKIFVKIPYLCLSCLVRRSYSTSWPWRPQEKSLAPAQAKPSRLTSLSAGGRRLNWKTGECPVFQISMVESARDTARREWEPLE